jgi:hypothetical protein
MPDPHPALHPAEAPAWSVVRELLDDDAVDGDTRLIAARVLLSGLADADRFESIERHLAEIKHRSREQADAMVQLVRLAEELAAK